MVNNSKEGNKNCNNNNSNSENNGAVMGKKKAYFDDAIDGETGEKEKILQSFVHQVSGRAHMLKYDATTICKSLSVREWKFYCGASPQLLQFTPAAKGILFVQLDEGRHQFKSVGLVVRHECSENLKKSQQQQQQQLEQEFKAHVISEEQGSDKQLDICGQPEKEGSTYEKVLFKGLERLEYEQNSNFTKHPWTVDKDQEAVTEAVGKNPWSLRQHRREMNRMLKGEHIREQVDLHELLCELQEEEQDTREDLKRKVSERGELNKAYLMLEDVTAGFHFPTILDLKVGTQLDRLDCSQMKRDKHYNLVQRSSTGSLRLRLAGMQVYQVTTGQYLCRDKYYGRGLCKEGFKSIIEQFLHNGDRLLAQLIPALVKRLRQLKQVLSELDSYRFYASSVLIAYEGDPALMTESSIQVYMIDFAHSTYSGFMNDPVVYDGIDGDCLYAVDSLIHVLTELESKQTAVTSPTSTHVLSSDEAA